MAFVRPRRDDGPLEIGRYYRVPCVYTGQAATAKREWLPYIGGLHLDTRFFKFDLYHVHVDERFLSVRHALMREIEVFRGEATYLEVNAKVYSTFYDPKSEHGSDALGAPPSRISSYSSAVEKAAFRQAIRPAFGERTLMCRRTEKARPNSTGHMVSIKQIRDHYAGRSLVNGRHCPHQHADLQGCTPTDGIIECPLHGLRFDAATGRALENDHHAT